MAGFSIKMPGQDDVPQKGHLWANTNENKSFYNSYNNKMSRTVFKLTTQSLK